jgi:hypothetical protein
MVNDLLYENLHSFELLFLSRVRCREEEIVLVVPQDMLSEGDERVHNNVFFSRVSLELMEGDRVKKVVELWEFIWGESISYCMNDLLSHNWV